MKTAGSRKTLGGVWLRSINKLQREEERGVNSLLTFN